MKDEEVVEEVAVKSLDLRKIVARSGLLCAWIEEPELVANSGLREHVLAQSGVSTRYGLMRWLL